MNFITYNQLKRDVIDWTEDLPKNLDVIVGVERSGLIPATMLALHLNIPVISLNDYVRGYYDGVVKYADSKIELKSLCNAFIVDDSASSGRAIQKVREILGNDFAYKTGVVYATRESTGFVDYYYKFIDRPRMFEWNFQHNDNLNNALLDIDGVIFKEPPSEDTTEVYEAYLVNPTPLYIPTVPVMGLVTGRLEKYREVTEKALEKYGVKYDTLVMSNYDSPQERRKNSMAVMKAQEFNNSKATVFIESSKEQADIMRKMCTKDIICIEEFNA